MNQVTGTNDRNSIDLIYHLLWQMLNIYTFCSNHFLSIFRNYEVELKTETEKFIFNIIVIINWLEYCEFFLLHNF